MARITFHALVTQEADGSYWAEVKELPGCFASGFSIDELQEALLEAMQMWLPQGINLGEPEWGPMQPEKMPRGKKVRRREMLVCA